MILSQPDRSRRLSWGAAAVAAVIVATVGTAVRPLGQAVLFADDVAVAPAATEPPAAKAAAERNPAQSENDTYVRIRRSPHGVAESLDTAIARYVGRPGSRYEGQRVDLFGVIHVGQQSYYQEVQQRLNQYDVVLFELVAPNGIRLRPEDLEKRDSVIAAAQGGLMGLLNLEYQLQQIDYLADNFRHADMSPEEFLKDMESRGDHLWKMLARSVGASLAIQQNNQSGLVLLRAMTAGEDRPKRLKQVLAQQLVDVDIATAGLDDKSGDNTLIKGRNRKALEVLTGELAAGRQSVAIFYGAGHLQDMAQRLAADFEMQHLETVWLPAWDLQSN